MSIRTDLISRIESYCADKGISEREFGYASVNDGRLVARLRKGLGTLRILERVETFLASGNVPPAQQPSRVQTVAA